MNALALAGAGASVQCDWIDTKKRASMKVWIKAGVIIFYVLVYCFLRKRMRRDIVKLFKAYMLLMIFFAFPLAGTIYAEAFRDNASGGYPGAMDGRDRGSGCMG